MCSSQQLSEGGRKGEEVTCREGGDNKGGEEEKEEEEVYLDLIYIQLAFNLNSQPLMKPFVSGLRVVVVVYSEKY